MLAGGGPVNSDAGWLRSVDSDRLMNLFKRVIASRIGQVLFALHTILVIYAYASRGSQSPIHFHYESLLLKVLIVLNLPSLLVAALIGVPFAYLKSFSPTLEWLQTVIDAIGFICISTQWWLLGYWTERIVWRNRIVEDNRATQQLVPGMKDGVKQRDLVSRRS